MEKIAWEVWSVVDWEAMVSLMARTGMEHLCQMDTADMGLGSGID